MRNNAYQTAPPGPRARRPSRVDAAPAGKTQPDRRSEKHPVTVERGDGNGGEEGGSRLVSSREIGLDGPGRLQEAVDGYRRMNMVRQM